MTTTTPTTAVDLISRYATDAAYLAKEEQPATTLDELASHVSQAADFITELRLDACGIDPDDINAAANYLADAAHTTGAEQTVLLTQANKRLRSLYDAATECRQMAGDD